MSRSFGGVQPKVRSTTLTDGCLGPFPHNLSVGDQQSMVFEADHPIPWYLVSTKFREKRRQDYPDGRSNFFPRTQAELAKALLEGANITVEPTRTLIELKEYARMHGIPVTRETIIVTEGWQGKQKGLLQVLWERGWIDSRSQCKASRGKDGNIIMNTSTYTLNGKKDLITGKVNELMSLQHLMAKCPDFMEKENALQFLGSQLGIEVMLTPKFHESAGEGIEYCWAHAKAKMRRTPIHEKTILLTSCDACDLQLF